MNWGKQHCFEHNKQTLHETNVQNHRAFCKKWMGKWSALASRCRKLWLCLKQIWCWRFLYQCFASPGHSNNETHWHQYQTWTIKVIILTWSQPAAEYVLVGSLDSLLSHAGFEHTGKGWIVFDITTWLMGSSTQVGTFCTYFQLIGSSVADCQALFWPFPFAYSLLSIRPTLTVTTQGAKNRFNPVERQCYFEDEVELEHFPPIWMYRSVRFVNILHFQTDISLLVYKIICGFFARYEMRNCLFEATVQKIERECNCTPKNFLFLKPEVPVCEGRSKKCMNKLKHSMGEERYIMDRGEWKVCLAACIDQTHDVLVTTAPYPNLYSYVLSDIDFCAVYRKLKV